MKKKLFSLWVFLWAVFFVTNVSAQVTIGNTNGKPKTAETFSALEVISNGTGGLRLPQLTTAQRNTMALAAISDPVKKGLANGLSIYNTTTNCVEYWNSARWISLCEGTSMTTISPAPCTNVAADGTGCDQTFTVTDPDCPNGPFSIAIMAGSEYATLTDINSAAGTFKVDFKVNESITPHAVLVRVTSSCTGQFKDFLFMQNAITCNTTLGTAPAISPSGSSLALCSNGAVYLSIPANSANLDKVIWTRNGIEVARGVNFYVATLKGTYNISLGAAGCNESSSNARTITDGAAAPAPITTIIASNNGIICGTGGTITLTAIGASGSVSWFKDGILSSKTGAKITLAAADAGNWFAAAGTGGCYSKPSNTVTAVVITPAGIPITVNDADVLINNKPIKQVTTFCSGGSLALKVNNPQAGVSYTWYNDETIITSPYSIPSGQTSLLIRMVATDNSGAACPVEKNTIDVPITGGTAPGNPTITGNGVICDGTADLTIVPKETGTYTYQWYKNGTLLSNTSQTISVTEPGVTYTATVTSASGCVSEAASKTIAAEVSSLPVLSWVTQSTTANFGDKITYQTAIENGPATYAWSVDGGATYIGTGASITVTYPSSGTTVNVKVKATNACGASAEITKAVQLSAACPTPVVSAASAITLSTSIGTAVQAKVSVANGNQQTYQWYSNTTNSTTGGTAISGGTSATVSYTPTSSGTKYLYCIVTNGCQGNPTGTSPVFTVNVTQDPSTLTPGSGMFTGKTCFDINMSNYGSGCGTKDVRSASSVNFKTQNVQPYVFTASTSGTKSNLRFVIVDPLGAVESSTADQVAVPGTIGNSQVVTLNVTYKSTLGDAGSIAYGKTAAQAVNVTIYAIYNDGSKDVAVLLNVKIQDCACCGAYVAAGVWKNFMCHNLGADETLNPFTASKGINGNYYQWGRPNPVATAYTPTGAIAGWNATFPPIDALSELVKTANDPCPAGYRMPTSTEMKGLYGYNTTTMKGSWTNSNTTYDSGMAIGNLLYLPAAGMRSGSNGSLSSHNYAINYWSSYGYFPSQTQGGVLNARPGSSIWLSTTDGTHAMSIRCIEQ